MTAAGQQSGGEEHGELRLLQLATNAVAVAGDVADAFAQLVHVIEARTGWRAADDGEVAVPVLAGDEVVATLRFAAVGPPDPTMLELVSLVAAQIGSQLRRRGLEDEVARANDELRRSNADLTEFAYVASHDLSEPLRVVAGHVQLLARRYEGRLGDDADRSIAFAVDGCARMQALINDLLEYSRVGQSPLRTEVVDTAALVRDVVEAASVEVELGELPDVVADPAHVRRLFANLVGNACKFTASGRDAVVRVEGHVEGATVTFTVADNGIGVPERHRERIFRMFQRLHARDEYDGTGIGLAVCRRIVERHRGEITVEGTPGGGATFVFTLPASARSAA